MTEAVCRKIPANGECCAVIGLRRNGLLLTAPYSLVTSLQTPRNKCPIFFFFVFKYPREILEMRG
jgi:hypothetical protein